MDNLKALTQSIKNRHLISFNYKGHTRIAEPYHYGYLQADAAFEKHRAYFLCYQIEGSSQSGELGFKSMFLDLISDLHILTTRPFTPRSDYNPHDKRWKIICGIYS
ncbi:MAG: hypothetical protein BGO90_00810 [Legionella sp. 40-6]|nr:hypothetical protein [Legionella sp.]OJY53386.1 MAG: hypothetical protein BGO90_00810 [Legionella sp. 40-6]